MSFEIVEATEELLNEAFPPKPGGLVDRARKKAAEEEARKDEERNLAEKIEQASYRAVKVAQQSPEVFSAITINIPAGGSAQILPYSPYRFRATILVVTPASTVILAKDNGNAISQSGFALPTGIPLPVSSRAMLAGFSATAVTVSVLAELYAPESAR
jgi:hypothetical protein